MTETSGGFRAARGRAPVPPDAELPEAIIRRLRDGIGEDVLGMATETGDAGDWTCELPAPNYDDATLHEIHDEINGWPTSGDRGIDAGDMQAYALEFIAQIREQARRIEALERAAREYMDEVSACSSLDDDVTWGPVQELRLAEARLDAALAATPDCAAEALRALVGTTDGGE